MDAAPNVAGMDYFHLYLFVKALRTLGLSINRQNCWTPFDPNPKVIEKEKIKKKKERALGVLPKATVSSERGKLLSYSVDLYKNPTNLV